jgi:hypothetical protein
LKGDTAKKPTTNSAHSANIIHSRSTAVSHRRRSARTTASGAESDQGRNHSAVATTNSSAFSGRA